MKQLIVRRGIVLSENIVALALIGMLIAIIAPWTSTAFELTRIAERSRFASQTTANLAIVIGEMKIDKISLESLAALAQVEEKRLAGDDEPSWNITISQEESIEPESKLTLKRITIRMVHETGNPAPQEIVIWRHAANPARSNTP